MKTDDKVLQEELLREIARSWTLGRVLLEHAKAGTSSAEDGELSEREELTLRLVELFPGKVTEKTICKVFDVHYSQAGKIVDGLCKAEFLEKKAGRGKPLALSAVGRLKAKEVELKRGYRFSYVCRTFDADEQRQLLALIRKMYVAAQGQINERVFDMLPSTLADLGGRH